MNQKIETLDLPIDEESDDPPWRQEAVLDDLLNSRGWTYAEVGEAFGVESQTIGRRARELGVNPGRLESAYTSDRVPVGCSKTDTQGDQPGFLEYEQPIPEHIAETLELRRPYYGTKDAGESHPVDRQEHEQKGSLARYMVGIENERVVVIVDLRPDREGRDRIYANERRITSRPGNNFLLARYPRTLARVIGLTEPGDSNTNWGKQTRTDWQLGRDAEYTLVDRDTAIVRFAPSLGIAERYTDDSRLPVSSDGARPEPKRAKPLTPLHSQIDAFEDLTSPAQVDKYRLELPQSYRRAYEFFDAGDGTELVGVRYGKVYDTASDSESPPAIIFDTNPDVVETEGGDLEIEGPGVLRTALSLEAETREPAITGINVPMALLHAMGIGVGEGLGTVRPSVTLAPGENWFAIYPTESQPTYNPLADIDPATIDEDSKGEPASQTATGGQ